jgi:hypothetical protein
MASRFYFENTVVQLSGVTSIDSNWTDDERIAQAIPGRTFTLLPSGSTPASTSYANPVGQPGSVPPPDRFTMHSMFQYTMPVGLVVTGSMRGELAAYRQNNSNHISLALAVHIRNGTTHRATLISYFPTTGNSNFYGFNPGHVAAFPSTGITDDGYITVAGDVLYAELGLRWSVVASDCNITIGYNNANADWPDGADGTPDTSPTVKNPWIEFETTLGAAPAADDFLPTLSAGSVTSRPSSPSKPGLHFFARDTHIESIWDGVTWTNMLNSLVISGSTSTGGTLAFANTEDINVTLSGNTVTWNAQALSPVSDRTKQVTLTDDASAGALLTLDNTFLANALTIYPPNRVAPNVFAVGRYGNLAVGAGTLNDFIQINVSRTDGSSVSAVQGFNVVAQNSDVGGANLAARGGFQVATATAASLAGPSTTITVVGGVMQGVGGANTNDNFSGTVFGGQFNANAAAASVGNNVTALYAAQTGGSVTRAAVNIFAGLRCTVPGLIINATINTMYGTLVESLTTGLTRIGHQVMGMAGLGTPLLTCGLNVNSHSLGQKRRAVIGANSIETLSDFIALQTGKGLVLRDTVSRFWRLRNDTTAATGDVTIQIDEFGVMAISREAGATGTVINLLEDAGTSELVV